MHDISTSVFKLRKQKPLILSLTNMVTMEFVANCLLAIGALPIMSSCKEELEELIQVSSAVYINIGTLDDSFIELVQEALNLSDKYKKPVIFDPVGAGATKIRTRVSKTIAVHSTIIRGNASEIISLGSQIHMTKGVDSAHSTNEAKEIATKLAAHYGSTVIVSGAIDFLTDGDRCSEIGHGTPLMQLVTGMGCAMTAVIAAFQTVLEDAFEASVAGAYYFSVCGEVAGSRCSNSGSFKVAFLDELYSESFGEK